jgi:hypothetical protein
MNSKKFGAVAAAILISGAAVFTAAPANAAQVVATDPAGVVVAQDQTSMLQATPSAPRAVTVTTEPGTLVTINTKGVKRQSKFANKDGQATFTKLTAGKDYRVSTSNDKATVRPVTKVGKASDLTVMTTDQVGTVDLTWNHKATKARGGDTIGYTITATPADGSEPITMEAATTEAELSGLDPAALYSFSVTPHNALGDGKPSVARMSRSLADITGITGPAATDPVAQDNNPGPTPATAPQPAPAPKPGPAPKPNTKTIYICPDGYDDVSGVCTQTKDYTFHTETQTQDYTYTLDRRLEPCSGSDCPGSEYKDFGTDWSGTTCPNGGTMHDGKCLGWTTGQKWVNYQVKDAPPMGWHDDGSQYAKDVDVKDATPSGWSDNGSQWIRTTAKVEKVVPA